MKNLIAVGGRQSLRLSKNGFNALKKVFLMQGCSVCDRPSSAPLCTDCQRQILQQGKPFPSLNQSAGDLSICALGAYGGSLKRAILAMKYSDRPDVARPLGAALAQHWLSQQAGLSAYDHLYAIPIPLHAGRQKSRGYNQAELIADAFCRVSKLPLLADGLVRSRATKPQHELGLAERQQNLDQVFEVGTSLQRIVKRLAHQSSSQSSRARVGVWLVDDIYTTGATAQSAVRSLEQKGITVVGMATVARAAI